MRRMVTWAAVVANLAVLAATSPNGDSSSTTERLSSWPLRPIPFTLDAANPLAIDVHLAVGWDAPSLVVRLDGENTANATGLVSLFVLDDAGEPTGAAADAAPIGAAFGAPEPFQARLEWSVAPGESDQHLLLVLEGQAALDGELTITVEGYPSETDPSATGSVEWL